MNEIFAQRFKSARLKAGLSLQKLSDRLDGSISKQALNKYEHNKAMPDSKNMISIANALNVKIEYFFRPARIKIKLSEPVYRKRSDITQKRLNAIREQVREYVERYIEAENLIDNTEPVRLLSEKKRVVNSYEEIEELSKKLRDFWNLGNDPIESMTDLLEDRNFKVVLIEGDDGFDGLSCWANSKIPVIVSKKGCWGDRQRSNLAHELGHLILKVGSDVNEERAAKRFSGCFLVPRDTAYKELGKKRKKISLLELQILKHKYGMSMQQWIYRAQDLNIISESYARQWFIRFRKINPRKEPGPQIPEEKPNRLMRIVLHCLTEEIISPSKAAELLNKKVTEINNLLMGSDL